MINRKPVGPPTDPDGDAGHSGTDDLSLYDRVASMDPMQRLTANAHASHPASYAVGDGPPPETNLGSPNSAFRPPPDPDYGEHEMPDPLAWARRTGSHYTNTHTRVPTRTEDKEVDKQGSVTAGVFIPLPKKLAQQFPDKSHEDDSVPHVTVLYIGDITPEQQRKLVYAVRKVTAYIKPFDIKLDKYGEFRNKDKQLIPHMIPTATHPHGLSALHVALWRAIEDAGIPVGHSYGNYVSGKPDAAAFKSHATLDYLPPEATKYDGPKPTGEWTVNELEVWGHNKSKVPLGGVSESRKAEALRESLQKFRPDHRDPAREWVSIGGDLEASYDGAKYVDIRDASTKERLTFASRGTLGNAAALIQNPISEALMERLNDEDRALVDTIVQAHGRPFDDEMWREVRTRVHGHPDGVQSEGSVDVAGVLIDRKKKKLLLKRKDGRWDITKGQVDPGESAKQAARREAGEESGIKPEVGDEFVDVQNKKNKKKVRVFRGTTTKKKVRLQPAEHTKAKWTDSETAREMLKKTPHLAKAVARLSKNEDRDVIFESDFDAAMRLFDEGRRRQQKALSPEDSQAELNRKADEDYLKWVNGYSDPYNTPMELDLNVPSDEPMDEDWENWDEEGLAEEAYPGGPVSQDQKLFDKYGHKLGNWGKKFMKDNLIRKEKGWSCSPKQAHWYKKMLADLEKAAKADTGELPPPKEKKKKKYTPSAYQQAIFDWVKDTASKKEGALVVDAKAGAGKSSTMEDALDFVPGNQKVVFLAFNKDIADALADRVEDKPNVEASTINAYGRASVVKAFKQPGTNKGPELLKGAKKNQLAAEEVLKGLAKDEETAATYARNYAYDMSKAITQRKMQGQLDENGKMQFPSWEKLIDKFDIDFAESESGEQTDEHITEKQIIDTLEKAFQASVNDKDTMEYADQVLWPVLHNLPIISRASGKKADLDWAMVDEVQDLAPLERDFVKRLSPRHVLVGDPNQSIYAFKGSDPDSMEKMQKALGADEKPLSICYRCPKSVIKEAQKLVPGIEAAPNAAEGEVKHIKHAQLMDTLKPGDFVLCRTNAPNVSAALSLLAQGKKAVVVGKDIGATLGSLVRQVGGKYHKSMPIDEFTAKVQKWHAKESKRLVAEKKEHLIEGLDDKRDCLEALMGKPGIEVAGDLLDAIEDLFVKDPSPAINFSSVHRAKGLEADNVFIQRPDLLPLPKALKSGDPIQEQQEWNLKYVAITRAKKALTWVDPPPKNKEDDYGAPTPVKKKAKSGVEKLLSRTPEDEADEEPWESAQPGGPSLFERVVEDKDKDRLAKLARKRAKADEKAGHDAAAEYWRGWAAGAFVTGESRDLPNKYAGPASPSNRTGIGTAPVDDKRPNIEDELAKVRKIVARRQR